MGADHRNGDIDDGGIQGRHDDGDGDGDEDPPFIIVADWLFDWYIFPVFLGFSFDSEVTNDKAGVNANALT